MNRPFNPKFNWFGDRAGHYRLAPGTPFPPACDEECMFLYLFIFDKEAKVGVSRDLGSRFPAMRKRGGNLQQTYTILLSRKEAFARELIVKNWCGERGVRHHSEWFSAENASDAVLLMRNPELTSVMWDLRHHARVFAEQGDPRYEAITGWTVTAPVARQLKRAA